MLCCTSLLLVSFVSFSILNLSTVYEFNQQTVLGAGVTVVYLVVQGISLA
jgi:hypothetical protein